MTYQRWERATEWPLAGAAFTFLAIYSWTVLLGVVTATLASWLVQKVAERDDANQAVTQQQIAELAAHITALRSELSARSRTDQQPPPF